MSEGSHMMSMENVVMKTESQLQTLTTAMAKLEGVTEKYGIQISEMRSEVSELKQMMEMLLQKGSASGSVLPSLRENPILPVPGSTGTYSGGNLSFQSYSAQESSELDQAVDDHWKEMEDYQKEIEVSRIEGGQSIRVEKEELQKQLEDEKKKSDQNQETMQKLEEKDSYLESEIQVLQQQAQAMSLVGETLLTRPEATIIPALSPVPYMREPDTEERPKKSLSEKQQESQDLLIKSISQDLGFSKSKPVAACLIYKCLLQWRSFEVERTNVFDRIIQTIAGAIESHINCDVLSYWLSNSATLLLLLQRTLKASGAASLTPQRRRTSSSSLFGRVSQGLRGSPQSAGFSLFSGRPLGGLDELRQVEAKYPALLFKQQLTAFLEKIYGMIRDNLKKEISPVLGQCIQAPRTSRENLGKGRSQANAVAQQDLIAYWQNIVKTLNNYLNTMRANHVPSFIVQKVFAQTFSFINVQLFNSILLRRECCSFSNGEYVKSGLSELQQWCSDATTEYAGSASEELKHIRQAVGFLVIHQKPKKALREITNDLCPSLSIQQLYRISTMYWDDKYGTHSVSAEVIQTMRVTMTEESGNSVSTSFILDDDSSIPFTVDDIAKSVELAEMIDVEPSPLLRQNSNFAFLQQ